MNDSNSIHLEHCPGHGPGVYTLVLPPCGAGWRSDILRICIPHGGHLKIEMRQTASGGVQYYVSATGDDYRCTIGLFSFATEPDATEPDATEPDATEPDATEPDATEPDAPESAHRLGERP